MELYAAVGRADLPCILDMVAEDVDWQLDVSYHRRCWRPVGGTGHHPQYQTLRGNHSSYFTVQNPAIRVAAAKK